MSQTNQKNIKISISRGVTVAVHQKISDTNYDTN